MGNIKDIIFTFGKAQFSAWIASAVDFAVTLVLGKILGVWYTTATFIGALSGGIVNCIINYRWVFHANGQKKKYVAIRYFIVWAVSISLNTYGTYIVTETTGVDFIISKAVVAIIVAIFWNYQMQRLYVFKHKKSNNVIEDDEEIEDIIDNN